MRRALAVFLLVSVGLAAALLRVNGTTSMPRGAYILDPFRELRRGDIVAFCPPGEWASLALERGYLDEGTCLSGVQPLLKRLAGMPGDAVAVTPEGVRINGVACPHSRPRKQDRLGRVLPARLTCGMIPPGFGLPLSDHPDAFDARYFGWVPLDAMTRVVPLLTFNSME